MKTALNLARLDLFFRVAASGSLTKAGIMLDLAPSAVSRQISLLESEVGGRLFNRTGRGVTLTELGERILPRTKELLEGAEKLVGEIKGAAGVPTGEVHLGILAATARGLVPKLFTEVRNLYPAVMLRVLEGSTGQLDEWISAGRIDIALVVRQDRNSMANEYPLAKSESYLIGPPNDPVTCGAAIDFNNLRELPLILPGLPNGLRVALTGIAKLRGFYLNVAMEADSMNVQTACVEQGCGYTILPLHAVRQEVQDGKLTAAMIVNPHVERTITLTTTTQRPLNLAGREVFRLVRNIVEDMTNEIGSSYGIRPDATIRRD